MKYQKTATKKILISWMAVQNDFNRFETGIKVNTQGPNYLFHKHFYDYDEHVLLSSASDEESDTASIFFSSKLKKDFPSHQVKIEYLNIQDVIDLNEIYQKVLPIVLELREKQIDIFFSPGTYAFSLVYFS
jgi:hypothetical protein